MSRFRKNGSVNFRSISLRRAARMKRSDRSRPVPSRLRSRSPKSPSTPWSVEKPAPMEIEPVDFSATVTLMTALSGALPGTGSISTVSKKSRF